MLVATQTHRLVVWHGTSVLYLHCEKERTRRVLFGNTLDLKLQKNWTNRYVQHAVEAYKPREATQLIYFNTCKSTIQQSTLRSPQKHLSQYWPLKLLCLMPFLSQLNTRQVAGKRHCATVNCRQPGFRHMVSKLNPCYQLPSRRHFADQEISQLNACIKCATPLVEFSTVVGKTSWLKLKATIAQSSRAQIDGWRCY